MTPKLLLKEIFFLGLAGSFILMNFLDIYFILDIHNIFRDQVIHIWIKILSYHIYGIIFIDHVIKKKCN